MEIIITLLVGIFLGIVISERINLRIYNEKERLKRDKKRMLSILESLASLTPMEINTHHINEINRFLKDNQREANNG